MQEEEDLATFIEEQRAKISHERNILKNNPPSAITDNSTNRQILRRDKENRIPENVTAPNNQQTPLPIQTSVRPPSTPRIFRLGDDYNKKREKLKEELRADYRNAMAEKNLRTSGRRFPDQGGTNQQPFVGRTASDLGLSLPLKDRLSAKGKDASTETYEELLERKRKQEKTYRGVDDEQDDFRDKPRYYNDDRDEDDGYYSQRRVRFPSKSRRSQSKGRRSRRFDDSQEYDDDDDFYKPRRRRRGRGRRRGRARSSDEESEYSSEEEERLPRRKKNVSIERRREVPSFDREATTGSLKFSKDKTQELIDLRSRSAPPEQEFTGLPIGTVSSANTVQRKKEEYRTDLLRQMEEQKMMKKKEKELDRQLGGTSINTTQPKKGKNTKDTSPPKRRAQDSPPPQEEETSRKKKGKRSQKYKFESSSDEDDLPRRGIIRSHQRQPYFAPPPPPHAPVGYYQPQYPNPYDEAYYYYGSRNPLDPAGVMPPPQHGAMYPGVSPLMAAAGMGPGEAERSDSPTRTKRSTKQSVPVRRSFHKNESSLVADETRDGEIKRNQMAQYQEELKIQIAQKEQERKAAKEEHERYEAKMEAEARNYNPWGKGGGGAPMKDSQGKLISDLRLMHLENEEAGRDPTKAEQVVKERLPQTNMYKREDRPVIDLSPRNFGDTGGIDPLSPRFGRSNPFEMKQSEEQLEQRNLYKDYLQKQIEEKKKLEAEKKERERIEDEKQEKRLEEQRLKIQAELDAENEKERNKKELARLQNEKLVHEAEERKKEQQRKKLEEEEEIRRQKEQELNERLRVTSNSPPIPTLQKQQPPQQPPISPRPQPTEQQRISFEEDTRIIPPQRQPVTHTPRIMTYRAESPVRQENRQTSRSRAESKRVSRELSALRKQLLSEQRRIENQLKTVEVSQPLPQPRKINTEYLVDLSRAKQKPVSVRRPPTVEKERPSSRALREFTDYKYRPDDTASIRMFRAEYPETPDDAKALERQQQALIARQGRNLEDLRHQKKTGRVHDNRREPSNHGLIPPSVAQSRASLLEAETTLIPIVPDDEENRYQFQSAQSSPPQSRESRRPSARERRRMAKKPPSAQSERQIPPRSRPDNYSLNSLTSLATLDVDRLANKNHDRLEKLRVIQGDDVSLTDPDDILDRFVNKQKGGRRRLLTNEDEYGGRAGPSSYRDQDPLLQSFHTRPPSVNTVDTEPWLRPETGPTVA